MLKSENNKINKSSPKGKNLCYNTSKEKECFVMFREPVLLTYRRPSNSLFLRDKKYFAYFTKEINGNLMVFTSTEKTARRTVLFGRFLLSGR